VIPINPNQLSDNLLFNGGFELVTGVTPDGWSLWEVGATGYAWSAIEYKTEGKYGLVLQNNGVAKFAIASQSFAVRAGEKLFFRVFALCGTPAQQGLFFRVYYHRTDQNWANTGVDYQDLASPFDPPFAWTKYETEFTVPAEMGWARIALYNYTFGTIQNTNYHIDDVQVLRQISGPEILASTIETRNLVDQAITDIKVATQAITTTKIRDDSITTPKLVALNVTAQKIAALAITSDKISVATLSSIQANVGTLTSGIINCALLTIRTGPTNPRVEFDATGMHSYDASGNEYYKVAPQQIGTKVYGYEWRLHPNVPNNGDGTPPSMVFGGFTDRRSNILFQTADGTELAHRAAIFLVHGPPGTGYLQFLTDHTTRGVLDHIGWFLYGRVEMNDSTRPTSSAGVSLYSEGGALGIRTRTAVIWDGLAGPPDAGVYTIVNGIGIYLLGKKA